MDKVWIGILVKKLNEQAEVAQGIAARSAPRWEGGSSELQSDDEALFVRWLSMTAVIIRDGLGKHEERKFHKALKPNTSRYRVSSLRQCQNGLSFVLDLIAICQENPSQITFSEPAVSDYKRSRKVRRVEVDASESKRSVFLVHGHDELNLLRLDKHLREKHRLETIILRDLPGKSRTLIEKFEGEAQNAGFAFALLTPDDTVQTPTREYAQARPNVAFELGWFFGKLGRPKVCLLLKAGTHIHSDLDGINRIEFRDSVLEVTEAIEKELRASGLFGTSGNPIGA